MNRTKHESVASEVRRRVFRNRTKRIWSFADFADLDPMPVAATLSRECKAGRLRRIRRGFYFRPQQTAFGETRPDPNMVAKAVFRKRASIATGDYNRLGLTTQVSNEMTIAVDQPTRVKPIHGVKMRALTRPISRQKGITKDERLALDALRNLRRIPDASTGSAVKRIKSLFTSKRLNFERLARFAMAEPPRVRAILGAIGEEIGCNPDAVERLRNNLNSLTTYRSPSLSRSLRCARVWHIR